MTGTALRVFTILLGDMECRRRVGPLISDEPAD